MRRVVKRIYNNFFRPTRMPLYDGLMQKFVDNDYRFLTISDFYDLASAGQISCKDKICIIRHDIDTDPKTAYNLFLIEKQYGIKSTYYYRWSTIHSKTIKKICEYGDEVGYHYEDMATICKEKNYRSIKEVDDNIEYIRDVFVRNYLKFKEEYGNSNSCASHGDWINARVLHVPNLYILNDDVRQRCGIKVEAYDQSYMKYVTSRISDLGNINGIWSPIDVHEAINQGSPIIYLLIHPRQWYSRGICNIREDFKRFKETIFWKLHI